MTQIKEVYSAEQLQKRIAEMGAKISDDYAHQDCPVVIGVLKGSFLFLSDLIRQIKLPDSVQVEFVHLSSYGDALESSGVVQAPYLNLPNISGRHILVVEDIIESGKTAQFFIDYLKDQFKPASVKLAVLLDRRANRKVGVEADYVGFVVGDGFTVGYGLDYAQRYRELPYLGELVRDSE